MIRLIQRRLIIPRGDTGSFMIPILNEQASDLAIFSILDPLTKTKILEKQAIFQERNIKIILSYQDTVNLKPGKYLWDIKIYKNPQIVDGILINSEEAHSYYAGYSLPRCEIRDSANNYLIGNNAALNTEQINLLSTVLNKIEENTEHYPIIKNGYWYFWNQEINDYINSNVKSTEENTLISASLEENNTKLKLIFDSGEIRIVPFSGLENYFNSENEIIYDGGNIDNNNN